MRVSLARSCGRSICTGTDLRHEGACRLLSDGVEWTSENFQPMRGHADIKQTQRYLNITDEELRKTDCLSLISRRIKKWRARQASFATRDRAVGYGALPR